MQIFIGVGASAAMFFMMTGMGLAQEEPLPEIVLNNQNIYSASLEALTILLVVAILIENALALVFNWKVYRAYFSERGLKSLVAFGVAFFVVRQFEIDVISALLTAYGDAENPESSSIGTEILTAMIVAGGSTGVYNVMKALGYRGDPAPEAASPAQDRAWIAVRVNRKTANGALQVSVTEDPSAPATLPAIAGTVTDTRPSLRALLTRNTDRFPQNGGYDVSPGKAYRISVSGIDENGEARVVPVSDTAVKLAPRAMVDFDVTF